MKVYVNDRYEIKDVGSTLDPTLTELTILDGTFDGWTVAKMCCYKVNVSDGAVTMMTPYVDSRIIDHIDQLGSQIEAVTPYMDSQRAYMGDSSVDFTGVEGKHITAYCELDSGLTIPTTIERSGNGVRVMFDTLEEVATVTISVM